MDRGLRLLKEMVGLTSNEKLNPQFHDVVFICIDCEAFESAQDKITEIGIAILDTKDLAGIAPGSRVKNWIEKTKHAHYRPLQYATLRNRRFIKGCEDGFKFGVTHWINKEDAPRILKRIFFDPAHLEKASNFNAAMSDQKRNIVVVGHSLSNDTAYLNQLGFSLSSVSSIVCELDTQRLVGGSKKKRVGLHRMLLSLDIDSTNLHNAGNDAAYTLQALVHMVFQEHESPGSVLAALGRHAGKLPAIVHDNIEAPYTYAGTAVGSKLDSDIRSVVKQAYEAVQQEPKSFRNVDRSHAHARRARKLLKRATDPTFRLE